jgi:hypothetical protein
MRVLIGSAGLLTIAAIIAACSGSSSDDSAVSANDGGSGDATFSADGAPSDGGASSDGSSTADAGDPCANSFFCDDFESYDAGKPPGGKWKNSQNGGSLAVDTTRAHSGQNSVKISANAASGGRSVLLQYVDATKLPATGNHIYGRMMFYLDSSPTTSVHWTFMDGSGKTDAGYRAIYRYGGQTPVTGPDGGFLSKTVVPVGVWTCAEFEFDGPANTMKFSLNGSPITDLTMAGTGEGCVHQPATFTWLAPDFSQLDVGFESYQADGARTMWIDDVAFGTSPLSCTP